jgi:hypothetical protein
MLMFTLGDLHGGGGGHFDVADGTVDWKTLQRNTQYLLNNQVK